MPEAAELVFLQASVLRCSQTVPAVLPEQEQLVQVSLLQRVRVLLVESSLLQPVQVLLVQILLLQLVQGLLVQVSLL